MAPARPGWGFKDKGKTDYEQNLINNEYTTLIDGAFSNEALLSFLVGGGGNQVVCFNASGAGAGSAGYGCRFR